MYLNDAVLNHFNLVNTLSAKVPKRKPHIQLGDGFCIQFVHFSSPEKKLTSECSLFEICYGYKTIKWAGMLYKVIVFVFQQIAIY